MAYGRMISGSRIAISSRTRSASVAARLEVEVARDAAELEREVDEDDLVGPAQCRGHRDVGGDGRGPDAALRAEDRDRAPGAGHRQAVGRVDRPLPARPLEAEQQRLDPGLELAAVERLGHDVVRAGLEEGDPLVDVVGLADADDRDLAHRGGPAHRLADLDRRHRPGHDIDDDQLVVRCPGDRVGGVGGDGDGVADAREGRRDRLGRRRLGIEQEDGAGGHGASGIGFAGARLGGSAERIQRASGPSGIRRRTSRPSPGRRHPAGRGPHRDPVLD